MGLVFFSFGISDIWVRLISVIDCEQVVVFLKVFKCFMQIRNCNAHCFIACFCGQASLILFNRCGNFISQDYTFTWKFQRTLMLIIFLNEFRHEFVAGGTNRER